MKQLDNGEMFLTQECFSGNSSTNTEEIKVQRGYSKTSTSSYIGSLNGDVSIYQKSKLENCKPVNDKIKEEIKVQRGYSKTRE